MEVNIILANWSNTLILSAMAVYTLAFVFSAFDLFGRGERASDTAARTAPVRTKRRAMAGATTGVSAPAADEADGELDSEEPDDTDGKAEAKGKSGAPAKADVDDDDGADKRPALRRAGRIGTSLIALAGLLQLAAVITRGASVGRVPWGNMMEYGMAASCAVVLVYIAVLFFKDLRFLGTFVAGGTLIVLGFAITVFYTPAAQVVPALQNYWIAIHVPIAIFATALLYLAAILSVLQLIKNWAETKGTGRVLTFTRSLPGSATLEEWAYRLAAVGFVMWTFTLIAGAVWAEIAWGRYWGWDPKEVWTFVVWVVYAAYLHARATRGWSKTRIAILNLVGLSTVIFNFAIVNVFINGLHAYSGVD